MRRCFPIFFGAFSLSALLSAEPVWAQAPQQSGATAASDAAGQPTLQDEFDKATEAGRANDCASALAIFTRLASDPSVKPGSIAAGAIAVRRGKCLIATGQIDEGIASIQAGLPILEKAGSEFTDEVADGEIALGRAAAHRWEHDTALAHYQSALSRVSGPGRLQPLLELANLMAFDGGPQPLAYADEGLRIAGATDKPAKTTLAAIHTIRGRILMNQDRGEEAYDELKQALRLSGGLTSRVTLSEAAMRGDLAQAALLVGRKDDARLYLAYTGAGRIEKSPFATAANMAPPPCGEDTGLRPEDSAIVEFAIDERGDVGAVQTVYSRGNYAIAASFARAVSEWHWNPQDLAKLPAFYKLLTRVELRCSNREDSSPGVVTPLRQRFGDWAVGQLPDDVTASTTRGAAMGRLGKLAEDQERVANIPAAVAALGWPAIMDRSPTEAGLANLDRAVVLASKGSLPFEVVNSLRVFRAAVSVVIGWPRRPAKARTNWVFPAELAQLADDPQIVQDALARDTLLLLSTLGGPSADQRQATYDILVKVADDDELEEHHPLRQYALLRLANRAAKQGDFDSAQNYFQRTGLTEQQCALIGPHPSMTSSGASSSDYPREALNMGFEGWVKLEFDIDADGKTANARPIIAYPPFVFLDAASRMARDIRYTASYRPSGGTACAANQETIRFVIPANH